MEVISSLIPLETIEHIFKLGFNPVPLRRDEKQNDHIPQIVWSARYDFETIGNNPKGFWNLEKLRAHTHLFEHVATLTGWTHLKDQDGRDLCLYCVDIDDEEHFERLKGDIEQWKRETYVVKTRKDIGYRVYWFEHDLKPTIKKGWMPELHSAGSLTTLPPSQHRHHPDFTYYAVGRTDKIAIIDGLYDRIKSIFLVNGNGKDSDNDADEETNNHNDSNNCSRFVIPLTEDQITEFANVILKVYNEHGRHDIIRGLAGMCAKKGIRQEDAKQIKDLIVKLSRDEQANDRDNIFSVQYERAATHSDREVVGVTTLIDGIIVGDTKNGRTKVSSVIDKVKKILDDAVKNYQSTSGEDTGEEDPEGRPILLANKFGLTDNSPMKEALIVVGNPVYVFIDENFKAVFIDKIVLPDIVLRPRTRSEYPNNSVLKPQYEFASEDEVQQFIDYARQTDSLYALYRDVRKLFTSEYFVDFQNEWHYSSLSAIDAVCTYYQDKYGTLHYNHAQGDNEAGKGALLSTFGRICYRPFKSGNANEANIREYLGTVEPGQGTLIEDEMDDLHKDPEKAKYWKEGYDMESDVGKVMDASSKSRRSQTYSNPFCFKLSAGERGISPSLKGVRDRTFDIRCKEGRPKRSIKHLSRRQKSLSASDLADLEMLNNIKRRLLAFRLVHFDDPILDLHDRVNISGRNLELVEMALDLFYQHIKTPEDKKIFFTDILPTLSRFLRERLDKRTVSLEGRILPIIKTLVAESEEELARDDPNYKREEHDKIPVENEIIIDRIKHELGLEQVAGKPETWFVADFEVKRADIFDSLKDKFLAYDGGRLRKKDGSKPHCYYFSKKVLESMTLAYNKEWNITIYTDDTKTKKEGLEDSNSHNKLEDSAARLPQVPQVLGESLGNSEKNISTSVKVEKAGTTGATGQSYVLEQSSTSSNVPPLDHRGRELLVKTFPTKACAIDLEWRLDEKTGKQVIYCAAIQDVINAENEAPIMLHVSQFWNRESPESTLIYRVLGEMKKYGHIVFWGGANVKDSDLEMLYKRCQDLGINCTDIIERKESKDTRQVYYCTLVGSYNSIDNTYFPRYAIDLDRVYKLPMIQKAVFDSKYRTVKLEDVAQAVLGKGKYRGLNGLTVQQEADYQEQLMYVATDARLTAELVRALNGEVIGSMQAIAELVKLPLHVVCKTALKTWWENYLQYVKHLPKPAREEPDKPLYHWKNQGGFIIHPLEDQWHKNVVSLDIAGQYPWAIDRFNISPDALNCECCMNRDDAQVSDAILVDREGEPLTTGPYWICKNKRGVVADAIADFRQQRLAAKKAGNKVRAQALKVLTNGCYGLFGNRYFAYADSRVAELVTAHARYIIKNIIDLAQSDRYGFEVIYSHTDSIFLKRKADLKPLSYEEFDQLIRQLRQNAEVQFGLELDNPVFYDDLLIHKTNNYFGFKRGVDEPEIVGFPGIKSNTPPFIRDAFHLFASRLRRNNNDVEGAIQAIRDTADCIKNKQGVDQSWMLQQSLSKNPASYAEGDLKHRLGKQLGLQGDHSDVMCYYEIGNYRDGSDADLLEQQQGMQAWLNPANASVPRYLHILYRVFEAPVKIVGADINQILGVESANDFYAKKPKTPRKRKTGLRTIR